MSPPTNTATVNSLYREHHRWLKNWLVARVRCSHTAADLAHDTFVRLLASQTWHGFDTLAAARAYLRTTARNLCVNHWRRQEIERAWRETLAAQPEAHHPGADREVMIIEALEEISAILQSHSAKGARAFILAVICGMTDDAVGAELGISGRMVRKHVARIMAACLTSHARQTALELAAEPVT